MMQNHKPSGLKYNQFIHVELYVCRETSTHRSYNPNHLLPYLPSWDKKKCLHLSPKGYPIHYCLTICTEQSSISEGGSRIHQDKAGTKGFCILSWQFPWNWGNVSWSCIAWTQVSAQNHVSVPINAQVTCVSKMSGSYKGWWAKSPPQIHWCET